jgi:hypothetical protein
MISKKSLRKVPRGEKQKYLKKIINTRYIGICSTEILNNEVS